MTTPRILAFAGSLRRDSWNKRLARAAAAAAEQAGAEVTFVDLKDFPMPVYDGDLEDELGMPEAAAAFKEQVQSHDALLVACPEYNSSISAALKNPIDWASRATSEGEAPVAAFRGKVVGLLAASPGGLGGLRGLVPVRSIFGNIGCLVLPDQVAVPKAHEAFDAEGQFTDERTAKKVAALAAELVRVARSVSS